MRHTTHAESEACGIKLDGYASIHRSGSVQGMRQRYPTSWERGGQVRAGSYIYNIGPTAVQRLALAGALRGR